MRLLLLLVTASAETLRQRNFTDLAAMLPSDGPSTLPSDIPSMLPSVSPSSTPSDMPSQLPTFIAEPIDSDPETGAPSDPPTAAPSDPAPVMAPAAFDILAPAPPLVDACAEQETTARSCLMDSGNDQCGDCVMDQASQISFPACEIVAQAGCVAIGSCGCDPCEDELVSFISCVAEYLLACPPMSC